MSEDEIRALAAEYGLDPKQVRIFEPYHSRFLDAVVYRLEYRNHDWNFRIDDSIRGTAYEAFLIRRSVIEGLEKIKRRDGGDENKKA